jgi:hypothetical protein
MTEKLTPEKQAELVRVNAVQEQVSCDWMTAHLQDYVPNAKNATLMHKYILDHFHGQYSIENLEAAFNELKILDLDMDKANEHQEPPTPPTPPAEPENGLWVSPITKKQIREMSREHFRTIVRSKFWNQFQEECRTHNIIRTS